MRNKLSNKLCTNCNIIKPISDFYKQKDRINGHTICKPCFSAYCIQRWIQKKKNSIIYKGSKCMDCPITYPETPYVVFEFHHRNPLDKKFDWDKMKLHSESRIKLELDKCDLLCANCHRIRHHSLILN